MGTIRPKALQGTCYYLTYCNFYVLTVQICLDGSFHCPIMSLKTISGSFYVFDTSYFLFEDEKKGLPNST